MKPLNIQIVDTAGNLVDTYTVGAGHSEKNLMKDPREATDEVFADQGREQNNVTDHVFSEMDSTRKNVDAIWELHAHQPDADKFISQPPVPLMRHPGTQLGRGVWRKPDDR